MKNVIYLLAAASIIISPSCKKIKSLADINVDIPYNSSITVPPADGYPSNVALPPGGVSLPFPALPVPTNSKQYISQYHTSTDKIVNVDMKSLALQIQTPPGQTFDFLDTVQVYISSNTLPEMLVAYQYTVPKEQTILTLNTMTDVNLKNYFIQDTIYFRLSAHINATPPSGTQVNIASVFHLTANPLD